MPAEPEASTLSPPELWGGVECTVNRVGDRYIDQLELTGHASRPEDLDRIAALGITAIRYPVVWERTAPEGIEQARWSWADNRLERLRQLSLRPIVGLVHHGSGPRHTSLIDPRFPDKLAQYARAVAERYPWVDAYTPVNEPLTTARFSGLYGHWYPHGRDDRTFARILLTECRAVVCAMEAIRAVNPAAQLVQTDDLGKVFGTPILGYQVDLENERRWLTFDLLCGRVDQNHPLWPYLRKCGVTEQDLLWFREHACPPDIIGINHYLSSERFLDDQSDLYPLHERGGNGTHAYADVLAARIREQGPAGPEVLLQEAWERYKLPVAVTEVHNGCTREEQVRWFLEVWCAARNLRARGADIRAVTAWTLLGAHGWDVLVAGDHGRYEPGVFDLRGGTPRPTAMASAIQRVAQGQIPDHPLYAVPGWWRRPIRFSYGTVVTDLGQHKAVPDPPSINTLVAPAMPRLYIVEGRAGSPAARALTLAFVRLCELRGIPYHVATPGEAAQVERGQLWAMVSTDGTHDIHHGQFPDVGTDRDIPGRAMALARACSEAGVPLLLVSSPLVFDGHKAGAYLESDPVSARDPWGRTLAQAERRAQEICPATLVARSGPLFGTGSGADPLGRALGRTAAGEPAPPPSGGLVSPTYIPDLVHTALDLLIDGECGVWHLANQASVTWAETVRLAADRAGLDVAKAGHTDLQQASNHALDSERGRLLPPLADAIDRFVEEWQRARTPSATAVVQQPESGPERVSRPAEVPVSR